MWDRPENVLDELLAAAGSEGEISILPNILKCHPPGNRDPLDQEKESCIPYLKYETYLLKPQAIVCLGRVAAQRLIDPDYRISRQHGTWIERRGCFLTATYHPSALLSGPFQDGRSEEGFSGDWRKTAPAGEGGEWSVKRDEKKLKKIKKVLAFLRGIPYNNIR